MHKPFSLPSLDKKLADITAGARERLQMPMKDQAKECEWLWEPTGSCPEQSLCIAVLQRAVLDLITPGVDQRDRDDALSWINNDQNDVLSFPRIVESFTEIPAKEIRQKILEFVRQAHESKDAANGFRFQRGYKQNALSPVRVGERHKDD